MLDVNVLETCTCFCHIAFFEIILKTADYKYKQSIAFVHADGSSLKFI